MLTLLFVELKSSTNDAAIVVDDDDALDCSLDSVDGLLYVFCHQISYILFELFIKLKIENQDSSYNQRLKHT